MLDLKPCSGLLRCSPPFFCARAQGVSSFENLLNRMIIPFQPKDAFLLTSRNAALSMPRLCGWALLGRGGSRCHGSPRRRIPALQRRGHGGDGFRSHQRRQGPCPGPGPDGWQGRHRQPAAHRSQRCHHSSATSLVFGYPPRVGRENDGIPACSAVQDAIDACILPMVVQDRVQRGLH